MFFMRKGTIIFWSLLISVALFRVAFYSDIKSPDVGQCFKQTAEGKGMIAKDAELKETGQVLVIEIESLEVVDTSQPCPTDLNIRVKTSAYPRFKFGDLVNFYGKLSQPFNFKSGDGRSFDYKGYLAKDDIFYEMKSASLTKISDENLGIWDSLSSKLFTIKRGFVKNLDVTLGEPQSALAAGLVVGEKSALGPQLLEDFRTVGLIHIVVLSGFNITVVADALRRMLSVVPRVWGIIIGAIGMILFCVLVGGGSTVIRSCLMGSMALFADLSRRDYSVVRAQRLSA